MSRASISLTYEVSSARRRRWLELPATRCSVVGKACAWKSCITYIFYGLNVIWICRCSNLVLFTKTAIVGGDVRVDCFPDHMICSSTKLCLPSRYCISIGRCLRCKWCFQSCFSSYLRLVYQSIHTHRIARNLLSSACAESA